MLPQFLQIRLHTARRRIGALLILACSTCLAQTPPVTYTAEYQAFYKGRNVGTTVFAVSYDESSGLYTYESTTKVKGIMRLASPKPAIDRSRFEFAAGKIRPREFWHQDGSRKGEDNQQIAFDWDAGFADLSGEFGSRQIAIEDGTLDRGSLQVAITTDLNNGSEPQQYLVADDDALKTYRYEPAGSKQVSTGIGDVAVVSYIQRRDGSSRHTIIDLAPDYRHIPMQIEQIRDGESRSAFVLESLQLQD